MAKCKTGAREVCPWDLKLVMTIIGLLVTALIVLTSYLSTMADKVTETKATQHSIQRQYSEDKVFILDKLDDIEEHQLETLKAIARLEASAARQTNLYSIASETVQ